MKTFLRTSMALFIVTHCVATARAQTTFTLNPLTSFGSRGDGSIQPGDSIGTSPLSGNEVDISAPYVAPYSYGVQAGDLQYSTNGYNMRGLAYDPVSGKLVFVDTHSGNNPPSGQMLPNAAIYTLNPDTGQIIGALNTNGIGGGNFTHVVTGVADDGAVYVCNQVVTSGNNPFKIYRWSSATNYTDPPVIAFSNTFTLNMRLGQTMAVRGSGPDTQIIAGSAGSGAAPTNVVLFTTADGTNFTAHVLNFPGITNAVFNDGIAFGPGNTFYAKQVGQPLVFLSFETNTFTGGVIATFNASSGTGTDPLLNLSSIAVDSANHLLAGLEEIGGSATGGRAKVWLWDLYDPTNQRPAILTSRTYLPNFTKATAPMGYICFAPGRLYANVVNNGLLASTVDSVALTSPAFQLPADLPINPPRVTDLPPTTRTAIGLTAHLEVFAAPDVTNYLWYSNNVPIPGASTYFLDLLNPQVGWSGSVYKVTAYNAAGSTTSSSSTLEVLDPAGFFRPQPLWSAAAGSTNYITSGAAGTPPERTIAYNALSNQLLVVHSPSLAGLRIFVVDATTGEYLYDLNTTGITASQTLTLVGVGVADDGAVYASSVTGNNNSTFKVYRWANTDSNTVPELIFGTDSWAALSNPIYDLVGDLSYRFGDALAVRGAGQNTEIVMDAQNQAQYVGILRPVGDGDMTHWTQTGYLLQNIVGSYGFQAYGTVIGRSLQFGPDLADPWRGGAIEPTFWQKRWFGQSGIPLGSPLAGMNYIPGALSVAALNVANTSTPLYNDGPAAVNFTLGLAAAITFANPINVNLTGVPDILSFYDISDLSQAVLLSQQSLPISAGTTRVANNNAIAQVIFGLNHAGTTNYLFVIDGNNGIAAYYLGGGVIPAPRILAQPRNLRVLEGTSAALVVQVDDQLATVSWFKGTNSPTDTGVRGGVYSLASAQASDAGDYFAIASNSSGSVTSRVASITVSLPNDNYTLSTNWVAPAGDANFPYVTANGGANTPYERSFAYNALSNQLIVVHCPPSSTAYTVYVVDGNTGASLYTLDTTGVIDEGPSEVTGSNPIDLVAAAVADDGAVYICNMSPNASGGQFNDATKKLHVYRWANSGPGTMPTLVYEGDPSLQPPGINERWGDVMTARGSGTDTELFLNSYSGGYGAVLKPTDSSMANFTNYWFADAGGSGTIGRSVQFGPTNTVFEKRKGSALVYSSYNTNNQTGAIINLAIPPTTLGGVFVDTARNLAAGVDYVGTASSSPDAVALYDVTDLSSPMFLARYNFPGNHVANNNYICQTVISGWRVYSLNANNGLMAFYINPSVNSMILRINQADATHVNLAWGNAAAVLQGTTNLPPVWNDLTAPGLTNSVQPMSADGIKFFRLIQRR